MEYIVYEDTPKYSHWLKILSLLFLAVLAAGTIYRVLIIGVKSIEDVADILMLPAFFTLLAILFWATSLHRKYVVFADRLKIVMGGPFSTTIPFNRIEEAREATGEDLRSSRYYSSANAVLIMWTKDTNLRILENTTIIYPSNREEFLKHLDKALGEWKSKNKSRR
ncbi:MAG: PH domain-containing protein [Chloroflexota bacterium]|nr:MAG: PH domain-containing protein [Chloroflexota bacterium]